MTDTPVRRVEELPTGYRPNVGVVLVDQRGLIFAGQRSDQSAPAWQIPQGGIDPGETAAEAALRELEEETGVTPDLVEPIGSTADWLLYDLPPDLARRMWRGRYRGQAQKWVALRFLGADGDIDLERHHQEFAAWRWMAPNDLVAAVVPFKRAIYQSVIAEFRALLEPSRSP